jgi:hypothetical protein
MPMTDFMKWKFLINISARFHLPSVKWYDRIHLKNNKRRRKAVTLKSLPAENNRTRKGSKW